MDLDDGTEPLSIPRSLVILRPDNLGDLVLFSGALRHLRRRFPGTHVRIVVKRALREFLELCPFVDSIESWEALQNPIPSLGGVGKIVNARFAPFVRRVVHSSEMVIVPVRSPTRRMHEVAFDLRKETVVGISGDLSNQTRYTDELYGGLFDCRLEIGPDDNVTHEMEITRRFLRVLGIQVEQEDLWPEFWTSTEDVNWAEAHVRRNGDAILLGLAPGVTSMEGKALPAGWYATAIEGLGARSISVVIFGSPAEVEICDHVAGALGSCSNVIGVQDLSGRSTVRQLVEGLRRCDVVVSLETAALHIATALRKPTIGIVGGGHFGRFYPWGDIHRNRVVTNRLDCFWCNWQCEFDELRCVQEIPPEDLSRELSSIVTEGRTP